MGRARHRGRGMSESATKAEKERATMTTGYALRPCDDEEDRLINAGLCPQCRSTMATLASTRENERPYVLAAHCVPCGVQFYRQQGPLPTVAELELVWPWLRARSREKYGVRV